MFRFLSLLILFAVAATVKGQTVATLLRGDSLSNAGNYAEAIEAYKKVNEKKDIPGSWRLRALTGMAYCNKQTGNYNAALDNYRRIDSEGLLDVRGKLNMSNLYLILGLYSDVINLLEPLKTTVGQETRLINLASAYAYLKRGNDALKLLSTVQTDSISRQQLITLTANRGFIEMSLGQYEAAATSLNKALTMMPNDAGRYIVMANLALAESGCGRSNYAIAHIDSCLTWQKYNIGEQHPDYAINVRKRAEILLKAGMKTEAAATFKTYFQLMRNYVCRSFAFLTDKQRQDFWFSNEPLVTECYSTEDTNPSLLYDVALFSKCLLLQVERNIEAEARRDTATLRLYNSIAALRHEADKGYIGAQKRDSLYKEADIQERRLMAMMDTYRSFSDNMKLTSADIAKHLGRNETAIEFIRYGEREERRYAALTVDATGKVSFVPLWTEDSLLNFRLSDGRSLSQAVNSLRAADKNAIYTDKALSYMIWSPLKSLLMKRGRIYFAPDGLLHLLAIENMADAMNGSDICRLSSTREIALPDKKIGSKALVMGGLSYDECNTKNKVAAPDRSASSLLSELRLPPAANGAYAYLPATAAEADTITKMISGESSIKAECIKGTDATETVFKLKAPSCSMIHLATHGFCFADTDRPEPLAFCRDSLREDDTMSRSGLVFAGANRMVQSAYSAYDDGILLAREASEMNLDNTALIVLSACQTGLGPITSEGVFGFQRGLKKAGAGAIVASLWNVDDKATKLLMTRFYHHLLNGTPLSQAFAKAKTDLRQYAVKTEVETNEDDKSHGQIRHLGRWVWPKKKTTKIIYPYSKPQYWAAFILIKK